MSVAMVLILVLGVGTLLLAWRWYLEREAVATLMGLGGERSAGDEEDGAIVPVEEEKFTAAEATPREQGLGAAIGCALGALIGWLASSTIGAAVVMCGLIGFAVGVIVVAHRVRKRSEEKRDQVEFFLPLIMERVVMAVQSGADVTAAVRTVVTYEEELAQREQRQVDPVTALLIEVLSRTESGVLFQDALKQIAEKVPSAPVRHAFIHLGMAHKEGGELVGPLRELSDATQLYYQESIEERIAKMPVRATVPLLVTFAGLILIFLTSPVIQVIQLTAGMEGP